jgi:hypothetical protein
MTTFVANVYKDDVADYSFRPSLPGACVIELGEDVDASEITVAPLGAGWYASVLFQQGPDDGDVAVTWANVTWFGGTPAIATGANAQTTVLLFSPDGVAVFGFGTSAAGGGSPLTPQPRPSEATLGSSQNSTTAAATQTGSYVQADVESISTLANALKASYNAAQTDILAVNTVVDNLIAKLVAADVLT